MKKVIALVSVALLIAGSAFAMDLSIALKGLSGVDNSGVEGAAAGGAVDINQRERKVNMTSSQAVPLAGITFPREDAYSFVMLKALFNPFESLFCQSFSIRHSCFFVFLSMLRNKEKNTSYTSTSTG